MATSDSQTSAPNKGFDLLRRRVRGHQGMIIGSVIVVSVLLIALLAPLLAPHDPYQQDLLKRLVPPVWDSRGSWEHVLGTDHLGRDYLSRLIYGARISLLIGIGAALISGIIGTIMGVMAGYFGGRVDMIVTFMMGLVWGTAYLWCDRNLWVVILAHSTGHVLFVIQLYHGASIVV